MAVAAIAIAFALPAKAQVTPFTYFNVECCQMEADTVCPGVDIHTDFW